MEKTVASGDGASRGSNIIKETVTDLLEGTRLVCSIFIFYILVIAEGVIPKGAMISIIQTMVLIIGNQGLVGEVLLCVVGDGVVKDICNFESKIKACFASSTVIDRDCCFNFTGGFAHCSNIIPINNDRFTTGGFVVQTIIEIAEVVLERGIDEAVANFHG